MLEELVGGTGGIAAGITVSSFAEWLIHKFIMHKEWGTGKGYGSPKAEQSHTYGHHRHYAVRTFFKSDTNKDSVLAFSWPYRAKIIALTLPISAALGAGLHAFPSNPPFLPLFLGSLVASNCYFATYGGFHHAFHSQGRLRDIIHGELAASLKAKIQLNDVIFSHPFIMDLGRKLEDLINNPQKRSLGQATVDRFIVEVKKNRADTKGAFPELNYDLAKKILIEAAKNSGEVERYYRASLHGTEAVKDAGSRFGRFVLNRVPVISSFYDHMARHHLIHHQNFGSNLNLIVPLTDRLRGTMGDSSKSCLMDDKFTWITLPPTPKYISEARQQALKYQSEPLPVT